MTVRSPSELLPLLVHDVRGPVGAMLVALELLREVDVEERRLRRQLDLIVRAATRVCLSVENAARLLSSELEVSLEREPLGELYGDVRRLFAPLGAARGVGVELHAGETHAVRCDRQALVPALASLLESAAELCAPGATVRVSTVELGSRLGIRLGAPTLGAIGPAELQDPAFWRRRGARAGLALAVLAATRVIEAHGAYLVGGDGGGLGFDLERA